MSHLILVRLHLLAEVWGIGLNLRCMNQQWVVPGFAFPIDAALWVCLGEVYTGTPGGKHLKN